MVELRSSVKAFTIVESILSMVIIIFCFGFASILFVNVLNSDDQIREFHATALLKYEAYRIKDEKMFFDQTRFLEDFILEENFETVEGNSNLFVLYLKLKSLDGKEIASYKEMIVLK